MQSGLQLDIKGYIEGYNWVFKEGDTLRVAFEISTQSRV